MRASRGQRARSRRPLATMALLTCFAVGISGGVGGCSFHSGAAASRSSSIMETQFPVDQWPERETQLLADMVKVAPTSLTLAFPVTVVANGKLSTANWMREVSVIKSGVYGRGIIRQFQPIVTDENGKTVHIDYEQEEFGGLQFVSFPPDANAVRVASSALSDGNESRYRRHLLRRLGIRSGRDDTWYLMRQGTRMRIFEPPARALKSGAPRGVMLHLSSLAGFEYEKPVIDELCAAGWLILQVDPSTARRQESPVQVDSDADMTEPAKRLARVIDNRVAEIAYAAEAGLDFIQETFPNLEGCPVVLAGYSAGALVGPSVATLLHDRLDAVVLVGGGANLLNISRRSSLTNGGISVRWTGDKVTTVPETGAKKVPDDTWHKLEDAYLTASRLDPYNTAPYLADKPVLVLHGVFDDIVPADSGDLLYERLGKPERVIFTLGHRGLFWRLPTQAGMIARWLNKQTQSIDRTAIARRHRDQDTQETRP